ncbi:ankyrin [Parathielavia hyrcaniae]|uniref:Ankyrin n=1 Tax=Parathielavia hyrcaniae TaxID=113614 RepID=A0AAN6Q0F6_9PEZI|nr:ankyrin [Parathielavia hyrcaniae]
MVALLLSLPNELLFMISNDLRPVPDLKESRARLYALGALSRTNRRLHLFYNSILYERGVEHSSLPLVWAAKFNLPATLEKALAAGASPHDGFAYPVWLRAWDFANDIQRTGRDWSSREPTYWPTRIRGRDAHLVRDLTPDLTQLDVIAPTVGLALGIAETHRGREAAQSRSSADNDLDQGHWPIRNHRLGSESRGQLVRSYTALHVAAREGHSEIVAMLLDRGASVNTFCRWFCGCRVPRSLWRSLVDAESERDPWAIGGEAAEWRNKTPLHVAICSSRIETAKLLVSRGARVVRGFDCGNSPAYGPLHEAAAAGYAGLLEHILDTHPAMNVDEPDEGGLTAFYHAYANRRWDSTVPLLLARGANIDLWHTVDQGWCQWSSTPLGEACRLGRFEDALKLIDLGADVNLCTCLQLKPNSHRRNDPKGPVGCRVSVLHLCSMDFSNEGKHRDHHAPYGRRAWGAASLQQHFRTPLIARLVAAGLSPETEWNISAQRDIEMMEAIEEDAREPKWPDLATETPLSIAVRHLNRPAVKALLGAGANVKIPSSLGRTLLMRLFLLPNSYACEWCGSDRPCRGRCTLLPHRHSPMRSPETEKMDRWAIARLLLDAGAQVNDQDHEGKTILHLLFLPWHQSKRSPWSQMEDKQARIQLFRLLLTKGADPCICDVNHTSVLRLIVEQAEVEALEMIAGQFRIELMDRLPMDEITRILAALPWPNARVKPGAPARTFARTSARTPTRTSALTSARTSARDRPVDRGAVASRLAGALMSMLGISNILFIASNLLKANHRAPAERLVEVFTSRGLEMGSFDTEAKRDWLALALRLELWESAYHLLEDLPDIRDINTPTSDGMRTLLSLVTSSRFNRNHAKALDIHLVEAGANIHQPLGVLYEDELGVVTPLKEALWNPDAFHIDWMLHNQPTRGNPQATAARYLHFAVLVRWKKQLKTRDQCPVAGWPSAERAVRSLLAAGADPAQLDDENNTPLSALLQALERDTWQLRHVCHWFKPLSRGVDINVNNKKGLSVLDYLADFLEQPGAGKILGVYLELVTREGGRREIKWLK